MTAARAGRKSARACSAAEEAAPPAPAGRTRPLKEATPPFSKCYAALTLKFKANDLNLASTLKFKANGFKADY